MAGHPKKVGTKNPTYQLGRRRYTKVPGYHSVLKRVFPLLKNTSPETAWELVKVLMDVGRAGFAVTSHPSTLDGHVTLWLSWENGEYLLEYGFVEGLEHSGVDL